MITKADIDTKWGIWAATTRIEGNASQFLSFCYCVVSNLTSRSMYPRYTLDVDLKNIVTPEKLESTASRVEARKVLANP